MSVQLDNSYAVQFYSQVTQQATQLQQCGCFAPHMPRLQAAHRPLEKGCVINSATLMHMKAQLPIAFLRCAHVLPVQV